MTVFDFIVRHPVYAFAAWIGVLVWIAEWRRK